MNIEISNDEYYDLAVAIGQRRAQLDRRIVASRESFVEGDDVSESQALAAEVDRLDSLMARMKGAM